MSSVGNTDNAAKRNIWVHGSGRSSTPRSASRLVAFVDRRGQLFQPTRMERTKLLILVAVVGISLCRCQQIPPGCDVTTTTGYRYSNFHHLHSNANGDMELRFRVMAKSDAHVALTTSPLVLNPLYEIVIGASGNNYTDLRRTMTGRSVSAVKTPSLLSDSEFRGFWVMIRQGEVEVGREGETLPYFHWKDPDPLPVHYYSLSSWTGTVAKWIQKCNFDGPTSWLAPADNATTEESDSGLTPQSGDVYFNVEEKLRFSLLQNYNKDLRPSSYHSIPVSVSVGLSLIHFDVTEAASRIEIHSWFRMNWRDSRLQWNASNFENITILHLPNHAVWQPDLALYNNADGADMIHFGEPNILVYPDGSILSVPPASFAAICPLDLRYWPYDTQTCTLKIGSWTHDGNKIEINLYNNRTDIDSLDFKSNLQWELVSTSANITIDNYECCPEPYPSAQFTLVIRRRSPLFGATIIAPAIVITFLTIASFLLPPNATEKVLIGLIDLLILSFFLIYFSLAIPPMGDHLPFIVSFYSNTLVLVSISLVLAITTITLIRSPRLAGPPFWMKNAAIGLPGTLLGLGSIIPLVLDNKNDSDNQQRSSTYTLHVDDAQLVTADEENRRRRSKPLAPATLFGTNETMSTSEREWLLLAYALDRLALVVYFLTFAIMMASYL